MSTPKIGLISLFNYQDMGVLTLRTVLRSAGYDADCIFFKEFKPNRQNYPSQKEIDLLLSLLKDRERTIVGISIKSPNFPLALELIAHIKRQLPDTFVIVGGAHATLCPEECIDHVDAVCIGEGERAMLSLADALSKQQPIDSITNLWVRKGSNVKKNDLGQLIEDLDEIPNPDLSKENLFYIDNDEVKSGLGFSLYTTLTARGCPFSCSFCSTAALRKLHTGKGKYVRQRSVESVIAELKKVKQELPEVNLIQFNDDVFGLSQKWVEEFCELYMKEICLPFQIVIHPQYVTEELMKTLTQTKLLRLVQVGIQSGSERVARNIFNRQTPKSVILNAARLFHAYKIQANYHLILDNPFSDEADNIETLEFLLQFPRPFSLALYSLTYFPKTELTLKALKEKVITEDNIEGRSAKCLSQIYISPEYKRNPIEAFYINLLYLVQINFVPRFFIKMCMRSAFLKKHYKIVEKINLLVDSLNRFFYRIIPLSFRGIKHLFSGRLTFRKLASGLNSFKVILKDKHNF